MNNQRCPAKSFFGKSPQHVLINKMKKTLKIFSGCIAGSFVTAIVFVITLTLSLPESDMAHGQMPFEDPLVFPIMCIGAVVAGIIVFPFAYLALRTKDIIHCAKITFFVVLPTVAILTIFDITYGLYGSFISVAVALIACRFLGRMDSNQNKNLEHISDSANAV